MNHFFGEKSLFQRTVSFLLLDRNDIIRVVFYSMIVSVLSLAIPLGAQAIFSNLNYGTILQPVVIVTLIVVIFLSLSSTIQTFQIYLVENIQKKIFARISLSISKYLPQIRWEKFEKINGAELMNRFFEVLHIQKIQAMILLEGITIFMQTLLGLTFIAFYHPYFLIYDLILLIGIIFIISIFAKQATKTSLIESKEKYKVASWLEEIASQKKLFSISKHSDFAISKTDKLVQNYIIKRHQHFKVLLKQHIGNMILFVLANAGILLLGGWLVIKGEISLGQLVAAELIVSGITSNFTKISKYLETVYDLIASFDKLESIFDFSTESFQKSLTTNEKLNGDIRVSNLSYSLNKNEKEMGPFSFIIKDKTKTAILGKSGSGKTTLSEILSGHRTISGGEINIGNTIITNNERHLLIEQFELITHPKLFIGTVADNITIEPSSEPNQKLYDFIKDSPFYKELNSLPNGIYTEIRGHTGEFSERIIVIISLLRALYSNAKYIIIDQCLDSIDEKLQDEVIKYISNMHREKTILIFTTNNKLAEMLPEKINLETTK